MNRRQKIWHTFTLYFRKMAPREIGVFLLLIVICAFIMVYVMGSLQWDGEIEWIYWLGFGFACFPLFRSMTLCYGPDTLARLGQLMGFEKEFKHSTLNLEAFLTRQPVSKNDLFLAQSLVFLVFVILSIGMPLSVVPFNPDIVIRAEENAEELMDAKYMERFEGAHIVDVHFDSGRLWHQEIHLPGANYLVALNFLAIGLLFAAILLWSESILGVEARHVILVFFAVPFFTTRLGTFEFQFFWFLDNMHWAVIVVAGVWCIAFLDARRRFVKRYLR